MEKNLYDLIIIGLGPAGLSAGIYAGRSRLKTLIIGEESGGQIKVTTEVVNYPGILKSSGEALSSTMENQAKNFGAVIKTATVLDIDLSEDIKVVKTTIGDFSSVGVIIATGTRYRKLGFKGEKEFTGRGVAYCATCDGEFFTNKEVFVIGAGFAAADEAVFLTRYAKKVTIIAREPEFTCSKVVGERALNHPKIHVHFNTEITSLEGDNLPRIARFINNETKETWEHNSGEDSFGVFVFVGFMPQTEIFEGKISLNRQGYLNVDDKLKTSVEGVYGAGDILKKDLRQLVTAVSDGAVAATNIEKYIEAKKEELSLVIENEVSKEEITNHDFSDNKEGMEMKNITTTFIDGDLAEQIEPVLDRFEKSVNILLIKNQDDRMSQEMETFLKELKNVSSKIKLNILERSENISVEEKISAKLFPLIALLDEEKNFTGVKYHAVPSGHEFNSFILGLYNLAGPGQEVPKEILRKIKGIKKKIDLKIGISLSCTMCPEVVQAAQQIALNNENVNVEFIDITNFSEFKNQYNIMSVPAIIINEKEIVFGKKSINELTDILIKTK